MANYIGSNQLTKMYLGDVELVKAYIGANEVYSSALTITNIVTNGDLSNGTTGWSASGLSSISAADNVLSITTGEWTIGQAYCNSHQFLETHKIYYKLVCRVTNALCSIIHNYTSDANGDMSVASPTENEWYEVSALDTIDYDFNDGIFYCNHTYGTAVAGRVMQVKYALAVDLTADFGAGNEPTKEQMDTLISAMDNHWFDGTITIDPIS